MSPCNHRNLAISFAPSSIAIYSLEARCGIAAIQPQPETPSRTLLMATNSFYQGYNCILRRLFSLYCSSKRAVLSSSSCCASVFLHGLGSALPIARRDREISWPSFHAVLTHQCCFRIRHCFDTFRLFPCEEAAKRSSSADAVGCPRFYRYRSYWRWVIGEMPRSPAAGRKL